MAIYKVDLCRKKKELEESLQKRGLTSDSVFLYGPVLGRKNSEGGKMTKLNLWIPENLESKQISSLAEDLKEQTGFSVAISTQLSSDENGVHIKRVAKSLSDLIKEGQQLLNEAENFKKIVESRLPLKAVLESKNISDSQVIENLLALNEKYKNLDESDLGNNIYYLLSSEAQQILKFAKKWDLHTAVAEGNKEIVQSLIDYFISIDQLAQRIDKKNDSDETPLFLAVSNKRAQDLVQLLLDRGANEEIPCGREGITPAAMMSGKEKLSPKKEVVSFDLLGQGLSPEKRKAIAEQADELDEQAKRLIETAEKLRKIGGITKTAYRKLEFDKLPKDSEENTERPRSPSAFFKH